jgi:superfamily II DNA or RNA helicase
MSDKLIEYLRRLDTPTLESLAGQTIVRAVRSAFNTNRESELARLVTDKYSTSALLNEPLRNYVLESLTKDEATACCRRLSVSFNDRDIPQSKLINYFSGRFTTNKSRELVQVLGLPDQYTKKTILDNRTATELLDRISNKPSSHQRGYLHPFQQRVKDQIVTTIEQSLGRVMVQMPTGAGKTATALEMAIDVFRLPFQKKFIVWLVDSNELAEQSLETFKTLWLQKGDRPIFIHRMFGSFEPDFLEYEGGFVATSFDKLRGPISDATHRNHKSVWKLIKNTDILIVDEAHTSVAETYESIIRSFLNSGNSRLIGLSATPARNAIDATSELANLYSGQLISISDDDNHPISDVVGYLQEQGYLAKLTTKALESGVSALDHEESKVCKSLAENPGRNELVIKQIEIAIQSAEPTLVFSCTKDHVLALMAMCRSKGIEADFIVGETPPAERNRKLQSFREGKLGVLINYEILATGVDLPNVRRLIITRPVGSPILFSQILGRALRGPKNGGCPNNVVITIKDNLVNYANANLVFQRFANEFIYAS